MARLSLRLGKVESATILTFHVAAIRLAALEAAELRHGVNKILLRSAGSLARPGGFSVLNDSQNADTAH